MTREELLKVIQEVERSRTDEDTSAALTRAERIAPHADVSDLIFYGERDRTHEEIADEALLREQVWARGGDVALVAHIESQLLVALADPTVSEKHYTKVSARILLEGIRKSAPH